jgi:hypothetical protein
MRAAKIDQNQPGIVNGLMKLGASVQILNQVKRGAPDLLIGFRGKNYLIEIKSDHGRLNNDQKMWHGTWNGQVAVAHDLDEAIKVIYKTHDKF